MPQTPWYTSQDLVAAVQRKISMPLSQQTFTSNDILAFCNEEMMMSQVPSVLQFHQEYYVTIQYQSLYNGTSNYPIPNRAIGGKLRNLSWQDINNNLFEMTRVNSDDKSFFQANVGANSSIHKFYLQGNDVVLTPAIVTEVQGSLVFAFFIRPNQLVDNSRAAVSTGFQQTITVDNSNLAPNDYVILGGRFVAELEWPYGQPCNYWAGYCPWLPQYVTGGCSWDPKFWQPPGVLAGVEYHAVTTPVQPTDFQIGATSVITATNLVATLAANNITASNVGGTSAVVTVNFTEPKFPIVPGPKPNGAITGVSIGSPTTITTANPHGLTTGNSVIITQTNSIPLVNNTYVVTVLNTTQFTIPVAVTTAGTYGAWQQSTPLVVPNTLGIVFSSIPTNITNGSIVDFLQTKPGHRILNYDVTVPVNAISGSTITFNYADVPSSMVVGDYVCSQNECIIPYLPTDLHSGLAERACARILAAIGDTAGLQASQANIQAINGAQGALLDNRTEGNCIKIFPRHSLLRYGKIGIRRRV